MAYTYIDLVNRSLRSFNEVPFADATEFGNAVGFHQDMKDGLNDIIREIYDSQDQEWPFQYTAGSQLVTIGDTDYDSPATAAKLDWDSFYIDNVKGTEQDFTSVTADAAGKTFTVTAGSFTDLGFVVGMKVRWSGVTDNSATDVTITTLTATVMTVSETVTDATSTSFSVVNAFPNFSARKLRWVPIDTYRNNYLVSSKNATETTSYGPPTFVVRNTDNSFTLGPLKPDATYLVRYDYFAALTDLSASTDVPAIPARYEYVLQAGLKRKGNEFRDNAELASIYDRQFQKGVEAMRRDLIPSSTEMRYEP